MSENNVGSGEPAQAAGGKRVPTGSVSGILSISIFPHLPPCVKRGPTRFVPPIAALALTRDGLPCAVPRRFPVHPSHPQRLSHARLPHPYWRRASQRGRRQDRPPFGLGPSLARSRRAAFHRPPRSLRPHPSPRRPAFAGPPRRRGA